MHTLSINSVIIMFSLSPEPLYIGSISTPDKILSAIACPEITPQEFEGRL